MGMGTSMLSQAMDHSRTPASDTFKAIYAIREQSKEGIVQIRGVGCLVNTTCKGLKRLQLVTCSGVLDGVAGESLVMDRYTSHSISDVEDYRLRYPLTNKKVDSFCFCPVDRKSSENKKAKCPSLALQVPVKEVNKDHKVITFVGNKPVTLDLEYKNGQHKVVVSKSCIVEKTSLQGAPIIDLRQNDCVVGLLQWSSVEQQFIPIFLKKNVLTELAQQNVAQQPQDLGEAPLAEQNHNNQHDPTAAPVGGAPFNGTLPDVPIVSVQCSEAGAQQNLAQQLRTTDGPQAQQNLAEQPTTTDGPQGGAPFNGTLPDVPIVSVQCSEAGAQQNLAQQLRTTDGPQGGAPFNGTLPDVPIVSVQCSEAGGPVAGESSEEVKDGKFDLDLLPYLAFDVLEDGKWITLARELGLGDSQTYPIQSDNKGELYEQCYRMLSEWRNSGGTFKDLAEALQRLDWLSIRQSYCLRGHSPSTKNDLQPERRRKLKKGTVQDQDIMKISYSAAVKEKRKRICRALLGVENADSHLADIAQNQDIGEQTYQIFRKWKQSKGLTFATYQALAQALLDRTVNLDQVVTDFCTAIQGGEEN